MEGWTVNETTRTALLATAALLPVPMTALEIAVGTLIVYWLTRGLVPPDVRFNHAGTVAWNVVMAMHLVVTPLLALACLALAVRSVRGYLIACLPVGLVFAALSLASFLVVAPRFLMD
jgi:hypothetical protein